MLDTAREPELDVLISGYGPTGATLAALLGARGWRVAVVEQAAEIYDKPRAITGDHEVLRVFQEIGIADEVAAAAIPHPGTDYLGVEGQVIKQFYPAPPPEPLGWMPNFMFLQPQLEGVLRSAVARLPSVETLLRHRAGEIQQDGQGVTATVERLDDGVSLTMRSRYLVAADGASSIVRRTFLPEIEDLAFDEWWLIVDAWLRGPVELPPRAVQYCRPSRPGTYMVGPDALRRWEIKMLPHETPQHFQDHEAVWRVLGEFVDTSALEHCRTAVYRFHALVAEQWRDGRIFLAGDAAHQMPPFLGQGLCAGVRDAFNLAWKLDLALRGRGSEALLDSYTQERKRHVRVVVGHAKTFGQIIGELDPEAAVLRDQRLVAELNSGRAETVRQRFIPGLEDGLIDRDSDGRPSPGAGALFVQPWVRRTGDAWQRLDDFIGRRPAVVAASPAIVQALDETSRADLCALDGCLIALGAPDAAGDDSTVEERDSLLADWLHAQGAVAAVVRPDRYVYGLARTAGDVGRLVGALKMSIYELSAPPAAAAKGDPSSSHRLTAHVD